MTKHKITWTASALLIMIQGIVYLIAFIPSLWNYIQWFLEGNEWGIINLISNILPNVILIMAGIILSIGAIGSALIKKGKPSMFMAFSFLTVAMLYYRMLPTYVYNIMGSTGILSALAMFVCMLFISAFILMAAFCFMGENGGRLTKFRFVPAAMVTLFVVILLAVGMFGVATDFLGDPEDFIYEFTESFFENILSIAMVGVIFLSYILSTVFAAISLSDKKIAIPKRNNEPAVAQAPVKKVTEAAAPVMNKAPVSKPVVPLQTRTDFVAEDLRKYKQLYDDGIITEEEFSQKKKQIMGL